MADGSQPHGRRRLVTLAVVVMTGLPLVAGVMVVAQAQETQRHLDQLHTQLAGARSAAHQSEVGYRQEQASVESPRSDGAAALRQRGADTMAVQELAKLVFTWDDHASYEAARQKLVAEYGAQTDDALLTVMMPADSTTTDADGKKYSYIDAAGLNMRLVGTRTWLVSDDGRTREYASLAQVVSSKGGYSGDSTQVLVTAKVSGADSPRMSDVKLRFSLIN